MKKLNIRIDQLMQKEYTHFMTIDDGHPMLPAQEPRPCRIIRKLEAKGIFGKIKLYLYGDHLVKYLHKDGTRKICRVLPTEISKM